MVIILDDPPLRRMRNCKRRRSDQEYIMIRRVNVTLLGSLLLATLSGSIVHAEGASTPAAARAASLGEQIEIANLPAPEGGVEWGRAEGVIAARTEDVMAGLNDYGRYAGLFPYFEKSRVLSQRGSDAIVYLEAKVLHGAATLWGQVRMSAKSPSSQTRVIEAKLMKGKGNISQLLARWEITPVDAGQRTHLVFQL